VLPDLADVALDEKATCFIARNVRVRHCRCLTLSRLAEIWWAWVVLLTTNASCDLLFLGYLVLKLVFELGGVVFVIVLSASSASGRGWLCLRAAKWLVKLFRGEGVRGSGFLRRRLLVVSSRVSLGACRRDRGRRGAGCCRYAGRRLCGARP
jgi:hypothetical protein